MNYKTLSLIPYTFQPLLVTITDSSVHTNTRIDNSMVFNSMKSYYNAPSRNTPFLSTFGVREIRVRQCKATNLATAFPVLCPLTDCTGYEEAHAFSRFSNWVIPGQVMVGRYPYIEPGSQRRCDNHETGMDQLEQIIDAQIQTFVCLQVLVWPFSCA